MDERRDQPTTAPAPADEPADRGPESIADAEPGSSALRQFLGLFVVPLLVVIASVAVFVGFGWIAYEKQSASDYLDELQSYWGPRRRQAAYELSKILMVDPQALSGEPGATNEVRRLFQEADDEIVRRYLAIVLGYTKDREAIPLLVEGIGDEDPEVRIYSVWALGSIGDRQATEPLTRALSDEDSGIRKTAAFALGAVGDPAAADPLTRRLDDAVTDVRWNAALALARLGDDAGLPVIEQMVDRRLLAQVPDITEEQQQEAMISAIPALAKLRGEAARPTLDRLAAEDPSLKVRQAAIDARKAIE